MHRCHSPMKLSGELDPGCTRTHDAYTKAIIASFRDPNGLFEHLPMERNRLLAVIENMTVLTHAGRRKIIYLRPERKYQSVVLQNALTQQGVAPRCEYGPNGDRLHGCIETNKRAQMKPEAVHLPKSQIRNCVFIVTKHSRRHLVQAGLPEMFAGTVHQRHFHV